MCFAGLCMLFTACDTIEDRDELGSILSKEQLDKEGALEIIQKTPGSNSLIFKSNVPNVISYWEWNGGYSNKNVAEVYIPFGGTFTITYTAFCDGGTVSTTRTFTIAKNDPTFFEKDPAWYGLTGGGNGKTWVWATDANDPTKKIAGNGPVGCVKPEWWTLDANNADITKPVINDEVYMDLKGSANFVYTKADGSKVKAFFNVLNGAPFVDGESKYSAFEVLGGHFPWPAVSKYHITNMTDDELSIHEYGAYNVAMYKRKGFTY